METEGKFYSHFTKEELIDYCEEHCQNEEGLFRKDVVAQMLEYARRPKNFSSPEEIMENRKEWYSLNYAMEKLVYLARHPYLRLVVDNTR